MDTTTDNAAEYKPLHIVRTFNAPQQIVWDACTKPEHVAEWYAPDLFTVPVCELDVRPQGKLRIDMQGPDGVRYPSIGEFQEVVPPERLVFTNSPLDADNNILFEVRHSLRLSEANGQTTFDLTSEVVSAGPKAAPYLAGMEPGLNQAVGKLAALVEQK
jgi:uncharacterized protein YndB with AHSA1/START domain